MQCMPSGSNKKWIMVYQDHLTKFCILQALASKRAAEVAFHLLDILLLFGAPVILQSDNGSEFTSQVITELKEVWPKLTLVHGKHRHPQSQVSVEHANGDIKDMLVAWMADNDSQDWPTGINSVSSFENHGVAERIKEIKRRQCEAADAQTSQAERMEKRSRVDLRAGEQGDNVAVPVPLVDRGRGDPRNILGVIIDRRKDTDQYRIAIKVGILSGLYSRNQLDLCPQRLLNTDDMNTQSASGGQGFTRCNYDMVLYAETKVELEQKLEAWKKALEDRGMRISRRN
ncbi:uncharacterized protein [Palaemon carinicauda]|uniref:uncharacterized protein n=1 Tax=Palaemon carinicauda TaxID=392227 RepID=UPI0035B65009